MELELIWCFIGCTLSEISSIYSIMFILNEIKRRV
jgi:hypothetical protein